MKSKDKNSFETQLKRLEEIIEHLDEGEQSIEELMKEFEEGMKLAKDLRIFLEKAEQKIIDITQTNKSDKVEY